MILFFINFMMYESLIDVVKAILIKTVNILAAFNFGLFFLLIINKTRSAELRLKTVGLILIYRYRLVN